MLVALTGPDARDVDPVLLSSQAGEFARQRATGSVWAGHDRACDNVEEVIGTWRERTLIT